MALSAMLRLCAHLPRQHGNPAVGYGGKKHGQICPIEQSLQGHLENAGAEKSLGSQSRKAGVKTKPEAAGIDRREQIRR